MSTYVTTFGNNPLQPSQVSYEAITLTSTPYQLQWPLPYQNTPQPACNFIDVTSNNNSFNISLPDATQVSVGQTIIFANVGSNNFSVLDFDGNEVQSAITPGQVFYILLSDNSTQAGTWRSLPFASTTSSSDASALAGFGLIALLGKLNTNIPATNLTNSYTVDPVNDRAKIFVCQGGTNTITLPTSGSSSGQAPNGFFFAANNSSTIGGAWTVVPAAGQTIDGKDNFPINFQESSFFVSNGSGWNSIGYGAGAILDIGVNNITVTGGTINLTGDQCSRQIMNFSGTLTSPCVINAIASPQQYFVTNNTTGSDTLNFMMAGGSKNHVVPQGAKTTLYCDGTDMHSADTILYSINGTASTPPFSPYLNQNCGMYFDVLGNICFTIGGTQQAQISSQKFNIGTSTTQVLPQVSGISLFSLNQCYD